MSTPSMKRRQGAREELPVTAFAERAGVLLDMSQADTLRSDALSNARLALAELSAKVATEEASKPTSSSAVGAQEVAHRVATLRRATGEKSRRLRELRTSLMAQAAQLEQLRGDVVRSEAIASRCEAEPGSPSTPALQSGGDSGALSASLAAALRIAHERLSELMGAVDALKRDDERRGGGGGSSGAASPNADEGDAAETEALAKLAAEHDRLRAEIDALQAKLRSLKANLNELSRERAALEADAMSPGRTTASSPSASSLGGNPWGSEAARLQALRAELDRVRGQHAQLRKLQWGYLVSQPRTGLRAVKPMERMREAMAFLKSTVIHFGQDLRKIRNVLRQASHDKEQIFKRAHNELKIVVGLMLPTEEQLAFQRARDCVWPVTEGLIEAKFPPHKLDTSYAALQEMVVSWDAMSEDERQQLTTAHDVVANAEVLYLMARFIAFEWREKRTAMKARSSGTMNVAA